MMQNAGPHWDFPLDFWERSGVRQALELAFDAALVDEKERRALMIDDVKEKQLREQIIPQVFLTITETLQWTVGKDGTVTLEHKQVIQAEIERHLERELKKHR